MSDAKVPDEFICPISHTIMVNPVTLSCGHTFDETSLRHWYDYGVTNQTCPICRSEDDSALVTNWSMKSLIEAFNAKRLVPQSAVPKLEKTISVDIDVESATKDVLLEKLQKAECFYYNNGDLFNVSLKMPNCEKRRPVSIVCAIDVSGSMQTTVGMAEGKKAFTRLDLVKHVLNTLVASLTELDSLALVTFSDADKTILDLVQMDDTNKRLARNCVSKMEIEGSTNTFSAIKTAFEIMKRSPVDNVKTIVLLTDGQDSNGPEMLERGFQRLDRDQNVQFNTFGFSNDIWSHLLESLATTGNGVFGFIPDQTMIGTIFLNFMANLFLTFLNNIQISFGDNFDFVSPQMSKSKVLNYNQTHNFLIKRKQNAPQELPVLQIKQGDTSIVEFEPNPIAEESSFQLQLARNMLLGFLFDKKMPKIDIEKYINAPEIQRAQEFLAEFKQVGENSINNEQLTLSLHNWDTWGAHYIRSFRFSHIFEFCINFKAPSMKIYTNEKFNRIVDDLTDVFCNLPPPVATGYGAAGGPQITMNGLMNARGGCIEENCLVELESGLAVKIGCLKKNMILKGGAKVVCLIKSDYDGDLVKLGSLLITPYHPIFYNGNWMFPVDVADAVAVYRNGETVRVCDLVLDRGHSVLCEGYPCITLGHGLEVPCILKHAYYGTDKVRSELSQMKGWSSGLVYIKRFDLLFDSDGLVSGTIVQEYGIDETHEN